jgi:hypothetical protein
VSTRPSLRSRLPSPLRAAAVALALLAALTACDGLSGFDGSPTPDASVRPAATPRPTPLPTPPPGAVILEVTNRQYSAAVIEGVANVPTIVYFTNNDEDNHNLTIYRNASKDKELFRGDIFSGPNTIVYEIPALPAGEYYFADFVFASMHGRFIVR